MGPANTMGDKKPDTPFPIVGIGASAGGLHSFECFLEALPKHFDFAVVFIQHLSPVHKSLMPEILLEKWRDHEFIEIEDGIHLLPGRIYLCPPAIEVRIHEGTFRVIARPDEHIHFPIDEFLVSLAEDAAERAVAVIFSGAGTDGVRGIQAIRIGGGTVFVQQPATAQFPALPQAAINTGQVDSVLPPPDIAREIVKLLGSGAVTEASDKLMNPAELEPFYVLIREKTGLSFNHYKKSVVSRRIRRRMYLHGVVSAIEYLDMVANKDGEAALLASDLMIGVTSFFRDRLAWKSLRIGAIEKLAAQEDDIPLRVWTSACATGEEAYSIAMMLRHELDLAGKKRELQVFATDVNDKALDQAREGRYPASISADVPPEFMRKFFTYSDDGISVTVNKEMRQHVIFAKQDLLTDPPFSRLDLVICRNLLIYLEPEAQEKCITLFHYALRAGGYLFLGNAESPGRKSALFRSLAHKKCRVYEKIEIEPPSRLPLTVPFAAERAAPPLRQQPALDQLHSLIQLSQETLLEEYAPAAVTIDQNYEIIYHNGPTNRYLKQPRGASTHNLLELVPENLRNRIRGAIYKTTHEAKPVSIRTSVAGDERQKRQASILVSKIKDNLFLIVFREKVVPPSGASPESLETVCVEEPAVRQLESELSATRQQLQTNIEQLKSMNEELQSSNEEQQAANEELETSREELQSLNEELITVNAQLQSKVEEQEGTNNDLNNFLSSTNIPTIFLDHHFRVKRYTPAITKLIKLIPSDVGRQIIDMSQELLGPDLIADAQSVLENLVPAKKEMPINGIWYVRTALPYRTHDNRIEGVVVTYNDVTELKRAEECSRNLASFPQLNPNPVIEIDSSGKVTFCNQGALETLESLGMDKGDVDAFLPTDLWATLGEWDKRKETTLHREIAIKDRVFGETIQLVPQFDVARIYAADITERKRAEEALRQSDERYRTLFNTLTEGFCIIEVIFDSEDRPVDYRFLEINPAFEAQTGLQNAQGRRMRELAPDHEAHWFQIYGKIALTGEPARFVNEARALNRWYDVYAYRVGRPENRQVAIMFNDITQHKRAESEREMTVEFLRLVNDSRNILELVQVATAFFQERAGCEAVGIRLREGNDYPYFETRGFPAEFVLAENRLCACDMDGQPILDSAGDPVLDCMCGNVICGRFDPSKPFFTKRGNFWSNNTTRLLAATTDKDRRAKTRNRCNGEGYESVALIGLSLGDERLGLLQLNDRQMDRFTPESLALWERLADYLAVALAKFRTDEKLQKSEEQFRTLADSIPNLAWWANGDGYITWYNRRWYEYTGTTPEQMEGWGWQSVHDPKVLPKVMERWKASIATGEPFDMEFPLLGADGVFRPFLTRVLPLKDSAGLVLRWFGTNTDISALKQAEEARRKGEKQYRELFENMIDGYAYCKMVFENGKPQDFIYLSVNHAFETLTGLKDVVGKKATEVIPGIREADPELFEIYGRVSFTGKPERFEMFVEALKVWFSISVYSPDKEFFVAVFDVITERKKTEEEIKRLNDELLAKNEKLEFANKELESFIYSVSHDLRGPLRHISGFSTIIMKDMADRLDDNVKRYLSRIHDGTERMSRLIDDLLNLSRISRHDIQRKSVDLSGMAAFIIADLREADPGRHVEVSIQKDLVVEADLGLMEVALSNLLDNSWKFTSKTGNARIEFGTVEQEGRTVFFLRDNGAGFEQKYAARMFWPFHRLHSEAEFEGTGIGLAIVDRIIRLHGGKVWAEGVEGKGATIYFSLT